MKAVLDTNIVRTLGQPNDGNHEVVLGGLRRLLVGGFSLHLAYFTVVELMEQVHELRFPWSDWELARGSLQQLLDPDEPIALGGTELLADLGIFTKGGAAAVPRGLRENLNEAWVAMPTASVPGGFPSPSHKRQIEKDSWAEMFDGFHAEAKKAVVDVPEPIDLTSMDGSLGEGMFRLFCESWDSKTRVSGGPKSSVRLDAMFRVVAHLFRRQMAAKPYNSRKRANDVFDWELLRYLAVPALVCTGDLKLMKAVEESRTWQRKWVLGPEELAHLANGAPQPELDWP